MRILLTLLIFASSGLAQTHGTPQQDPTPKTHGTPQNLGTPQQDPAPKALGTPQQGPPPKNLVRQPDGHFTANQEPANPEKFEVRIVKAGDTLSQIAGEVLENPRLWPQLWEQNEHIVNPHWIYPNDKILIKPLTLITEAEPPPPEPPVEPVPEPPPAPPLVRSGQQPPPPAPEPQREPVFALTPERVVPEVKDDDLYCSGFIRLAELSHDLKVIGKFNDDLSVFATDSEYVYISRGSAGGIAAGNSYNVIRPTRTVTNPIGRTKTERMLGKHYLEIGQVDVILVQPAFSIARVVRNCGEPVEVGDIMLPFQRINLPALPRPRSFNPLMTVTGDVKGSVVITQSALVNYGSVMELSRQIPGVTYSHLESLSRGVAAEGVIVYVDVGQNAGVKPGDLFIVYKGMPRPSGLYSLPADAKRIRDARYAVGEIVILKVDEKASTALVTYASDAISQGDFVERR
jgi:LysM domain